MKAKPILFSAPMVRAILREVQHPGTGKTQTRRVLKPQSFIDQSGNLCSPNKDGTISCWGQGADGRPYWRHYMARHAPYAPGDVLWVRETWMVCGDGVWTIADARMRMAPRQRTIYAADATGADASGPWWPSIHMPREFSRLTLEATGVKVERLQDISEADAIAEGAGQYSSSIKLHRDRPYDPSLNGIYREGFSELWEGINGAGAWDANPWVVAVTYKPHLINVDAFLAQRVAA